MDIVTVLRTGGDFNEAHVEWIQRQVGRQIVCLTDSKEEMRAVAKIPLTQNLGGWWSKMEMFRPDNLLTDFLYVDLDTVFLYGVPHEVFTLRETVVLSDMYGGEHINSGLMHIRAEDKHAVWEDWQRDPMGHMTEAGNGGDQKFLDKHFRDKKRWQGLFPNMVISFKADYQKRGWHGGEQIVCFHGQPRPWAVMSEHPWIPQ